MKPVILLIAAALLISACSGESKKETIKVEDFFTSYLTLICDTAASYTGGLVSVSGKATCPSAILDIPIPYTYFHESELTIFKQKKNLLMRAELDGVMEIEKEQAQKCFDVIKEMAPYNPLDIRLLDIAECAMAFKGSRVVNDHCAQDEECDNGWCNLSSACPGRCVLYKTKGQACNSSLDRCEPGYVCRNSGCSRVSQGNAGDPCSNDKDCISYLYCRKLSQDDSTGTCFRRKGLKEKCTLDGECLTGMKCLDDVCSGGNIPDKAGADCSESKLCNYFSKLECSEALTCRAFSKKPDEPCTLQCEGALYCDRATKVCKRARFEDDPCTNYFECTSLYCASEGVCKYPECQVNIEK